MATLSTTPLNVSEIDLLNECRAHTNCSAISLQIHGLQSQIQKLQAQKVAADASLQVTLAKVLASKSVPVPPGAKISRQIVNGVDSLIVTS